MADIVDRLAQAIRVADGDHTMGAGALAEALLPTINEFRAEALESFAMNTSTGDYGYGGEYYDRSADGVLSDADDMAQRIRKGLE